MTPSRSARRAAAAIGLLLAAGPWARGGAAALSFSVREGENLNVFERQGPVAAHLLVRDGNRPRLLVAFPAGDSGAAVWFEPTRVPVRWRLLGPVRPVLLSDGRGRPLHGIRVDLQADAGELAVRRSVLGSVRVLRDVELGAKPPPALTTPAVVTGSGVTWARPRLDGAAGYDLSLVVLDGEVSPDGGTLKAAPGRPLRVRLTAATGETPLTSLDADQILTPAAGRDPRARASLAFLSYREKLLAGSWRFDTYFGRDTLMSVRLLLPVLKPDEAEAGLGAVLARLSPAGEVAHEEDVGEFAVMDNLKAGRGLSDAPSFDYKMIDADYLLAPVVQAYAERFGARRLEAFLEKTDPSGVRFGDRLARNLRHVVETTRAFAARPSTSTLLRLKPGVPVGQWRDSDAGLGGGRIPYDVNAVFAPAALRAIADLCAGGAPAACRDPALGPEAAAAARTWAEAAPPLFRVRITADEARADVVRFAREMGVDPAPALASAPSSDLEFEALSLDAAGRPIPILNSDAGFELLFGRPSPARAQDIVRTLMRPFPAGLMTEVGPVVADAAYADAAERRLFPRTAYHGAVVWAWQEAVLIAGLDRQLAQADLPPEARRLFRDARARLWRAVDAVGGLRTSELWSWSFRDGRYRPEAFGAGRGDADESNAAQLWSTVFLALRRPAGSS